MRLGMFSSSSGWPPVSIMWTSSSISGLAVFLDDLTSLTIDIMVELLAAGEDSGRWGTSGEELVDEVAEEVEVGEREVEAEAMAGEREGST